MANEAQVRVSLQIQKRDPATQIPIINYVSSTLAFTPNVAGVNGPTPGTILVATTGTNISLAQITFSGGLCLLANQDTANYVTYGVYDSVSNRFDPWGELLPGEGYIMRLSRDMLTKEYQGSGTAVAVTNTLRMYAHVAPCIVFVGAFDA